MRKLVACFMLLLVGACGGEATDPVAAESERIVREGYAAFARGDMDAVMATMSPELVWYEAEGLPIGGVYHGPQAVMENVFAMIGAEWERYETRPERIIASGNEVAVWGRYRGIHRESGRQLDVPFVHIWILEDGKLVEFHQLTDTALYNSAMGVSGTAE
ncbi:MAG: nuclear transport factor 2 family protein [Gammaproteobacteria bacterium]|nr:nuclear transport factor 2 family protein [Gammaproteobacteria bacterium]